MGSLGYGAIIIGVLLLRQVFIGRARETPADLRDFATAILSGDFESVKTVAAQRGDATATETVSSGAIAPASSGLTSFGQSPLEVEMKRLGTGKPYVFGAEGPNAYDCSGLVWRATQNLGLTNSARYVVGGFAPAMGSKVSRISGPERGAVVVWPGAHIGIVDGADSYFSAKNPTSGIKSDSLSEEIVWFRQNEGVSPIYFRVNK